MVVMKKRGSILIFIFIMLAFISIVGTIFLKNSALFHSFALDRVNAYKMDLALKALTYYGIAHCFDRPSLVDPEHIELLDWDETGCYGIIDIQPTSIQGQMALRVALAKNNNIKSEALCYYYRTDDHSMLKEWKKL